jgi:thymidylate synthase
MQKSAAQCITNEYKYLKFRRIVHNFSSTKELGPVYGNQWRHWPDGKGGRIDQIATLIDGLKKDQIAEDTYFMLGM